MKALYKPFGFVVGLAAGLLAKSLFNKVWALIDDEEAPQPLIREVTWPRALGTAALRGAVYGTTREAVNRAGAQGYAYLTGVWPGEQEREDTD